MTQQFTKEEITNQALLGLEKGTQILNANFSSNIPLTSQLYCATFLSIAIYYMNKALIDGCILSKETMGQVYEQVHKEYINSAYIIVKSKEETNGNE